MRRRATGGADLVNLPSGFHEGVPAAGLRQAIGIDIPPVRKILLEFEDSSLRGLLPAADTPFQTANVIVSLVRMFQYSCEHDRRQPGTGKLFSLDCR